MSDTPSEDLNQDLVEKPVAKKAAKKATKKKTAKKAAKKTAKKAAKKTAKKAAKKATKKVAKKAEPKAEEKVSAQTELNLSTPPATPAPAEKETKPAPKLQATPKAEESNEQPKAKDSSEDRPEEKQQRRGRVKGGGRVDQRNNNQRNQKHHKKNNRNNRNRKQKGNNREPKEKKVELTGPPIAVSGILELSQKGFGFLRTLDKGLEQSNNDVFVTPDLIRTHGLRLGVWLEGEAQQGPRGLQMTSVKTVNERTPDEARKFPHFEELKAVNPDKRLSFETTPDRYTTRVLDIISPVGRGQRGLIVSPPRSGKTTMMLHMAEAMQEKYDESMHLMILLVDERPEEVTEFKQMLPDAEIYASSNDAGAKNHCRVAELCIERAKRLVEAGEHVFLLMDSITRLARAYNSALGGNKKKGKGRGIQSGGIITGALEMPRRIFAAARNTRTAGSLTIVATALVHTNSRADDAIFQEFKGTGNMELVLDRRIAEQYIYPAVDIFKSGTRREELILPEISLHKIHLIRRGLAGARPHEAMERLLFFLKRFPNNAQMLLEIKG